ncbi:hypothetical protein MMC14_005291 [Varicellaria rhodocarpa]|nr:hypothetical protein [Varicellaria rhodocarpa]
MAETFDFIIVGAGIGGCVLASRLSQASSSYSVLLIEAGPDVTDHPLVPNGMKYSRLLHSELDWDYKTVTQCYLDNRACYQAAGKAVSGGSAIKGGGWLRGDEEDYNDWARLFRKTEHHHDEKSVNTEIHGVEGPIRTESVSSTGRKYPLRDQIKAAWASAGVHETADMNSGSPLGVGELVENRQNGMRQLASTSYDLSRVKVITETLVKCVMIDDENQATGVELSDGAKIAARREVIISSGAYRTPQVLMLSGIGPSDELKKHGIAQKVHSPGVGKNFHDHFAVTQWWALRHPEKNLAMGSPGWTDPSLFRGLPMDFVTTQSVPLEGLKRALTIDEGRLVGHEHPLVHSPRAHHETYVVYAGANAENPKISLDDSHITTSIVIMLLTSRGLITLASKDPSDAPLIHPNYCATEADRYVFREGLIKIMSML